MFVVMGTSNFSEFMSRERWHVIKTCLTAIDEESDAPAVAENDPTFDRLWRIRPVLSRINATFKRIGKPGREVSLDEMMVKCKGALFGLAYCACHVDGAVVVDRDCVMSLFFRTCGDPAANPHETNT